MIRMQDPLKQGLKPHLFISFRLDLLKIRMQDPLKQGLKLKKVERDAQRVLKIRMQDPLKQGLKRSEPPDRRIKHSRFECKIH